MLDNIITDKTISDDKNLSTPKNEVEKRNIFKGPYKQKMKILKGGNYRLNGILYNMLPDEYIDGSLLSPKKREILINTKFIIRED